MTEPQLADAPANEPVDANTRLLRALPAPVFTVAYGAVLIGLIAGGIVLADTASSHEDAPPSVGKPLRPFNPVETSADNVEASVRTYLIADAATARTSTGVTLTGTMTDTAEASLAEFSGHVSRLLQQNCVDNMTVRTQDNLRINLWGYCYNSPGPAAIESYVTDALAGTTDSVSFYFYPGRPVEHMVAMTWFSNSPAAANSIVDSWDDLEPVEPTDQLVLTAYDPEKVRVQEKYGRRVDRPDEYFEDPTGKAFREKWDAQQRG
ncbi:hypothetical protein RIU96_10465 [Corynebacterium sp. Z-1]|uniref:hypothetical protein n=1 Tax=Corynebacterium sp. Z-1 TaxID=3074378 RepID=UPI002882D96F|nr:hypothetical protein [Corynebacterium sp. Z-1]WNI12621.1 hypothetical protein RIU96_10465 [Corynebacterium sp. Z-1]